MELAIVSGIQVKAFRLAETFVPLHEFCSCVSAVKKVRSPNYQTIASIVSKLVRVAILIVPIC